MLTWLREDRDGDYWRGGSVRLGGRGRATSGSVPAMIVAGWADGYRNNTFRTVAGTGRGRGAPPTARGPVGPRGPGHGDARSADRPRRRDGGVVRPLAARPGLEAPYDSRCDVFVRSSTRPAPDLDLHEGGGSGCRPSHRPPDGGRGCRPAATGGAPDAGTAAWIDCAGHLPWGQSGDQRRDDARSLTWDRPRRPTARRTAARPPAAQRGRPRGLAVGQALRRVPRRHLGPGRPGHPGPGVPRRRARRSGAARAGARSTTSCSTSTRVPTPAGGKPAAGERGRVGLAQHRRPAGARGPDRARRRGGAAGARRGTSPAPIFVPGAAPTSGSAGDAAWEIPTTCCAGRRTPAPPVGGLRHAVRRVGRRGLAGEVSVDRRTHEQHAHAVTTFDLAWPEVSGAAALVDGCVDHRRRTGRHDRDRGDAVRRRGLDAGLARAAAAPALTCTGPEMHAG